jgi:hypothetical protein
MKEIKLPVHNIMITLDGQGGGTIVARDLFVEVENDEDELHNSGMNGITSMILACACAGVDVESPQFLEAIETSIGAVAENI